MAGKIQKNCSDAFKFKVAIAAITEDRTIEDLCQEFKVTASQIYAWKKQLRKKVRLFLQTTGAQKIK